MVKLEVNFDLIDKAYEAQGKYKVRRWFRENKTYNIIASFIPITHLALTLGGLESPEVALIRTATSTSINYGIWAVLDKTLETIRTKATGISPQLKAMMELVIITEALNQIMNINTSVEGIMNAEVYQKNYKLATDGRVGVIRERFIDLPITNALGEEDTTSVKEEHLIGSKKYVLTLDKPVEQKEYKLAYNM